MINEVSTMLIWPLPVMSEVYLEEEIEGGKASGITNLLTEDIHLCGASTE